MNAPRRKVTCRVGPLELGASGVWHFDLSCGHVVRMTYPADLYKRAKSMRCWSCVRGECVKHDIVDTDEGQRCTRCKAFG